MTKSEAVEKMNMIVANSTSGNGEVYDIKVNDWDKEGKSRTYFAIARTWRSKYATKKYGYIDNVSGEYIPETYGNLNNNFTYDGAKF